MSLFGMGPLEIVLIVVLALIVFGPARLPEIMGQVGKAIADFRRATSELSDEFNKTIQAELKETRAVVDDARSTVTGLHATVTDLHATVNSAVSGSPAPVRTAVPGPIEAPPAEASPAEASSVANGSGGEQHLENGTNGTAVATIPPLADSVQWSWDTSASPPASPSASSSTSSTEASTAAGETPKVELRETASPTHERAAHDELLPPY